jgi:hypothetical protein
MILTNLKKTKNAAQYFIFSIIFNNESEKNPMQNEFIS